MPEYQPQTPGFQMRLTERRKLGFEYVNYRGEHSRRIVYPQRIWFGATPYHTEPQWIMDAVDVVTDAYRSFAMRDMTNVQLEPEE